MLGSPENPHYQVGRVALRAPLLACLIAFVIRAVGATLRIRLRDEAGYFTGQHCGPYVFAFWHNRAFVMPVVFARFYRKRNVPPKGLVILTSASGEGTLLAQIIGRFGMSVVRGSSSRRGAAALRELTARIEGGFDVAVTPDGSRGPVYRIGPGIIFLAGKTGVPLMPIHVRYSHCVRLKSWDSFMIPLPFSRVDVVLKNAIHVTDGDVESQRAHLEELMHD
ncbi:MAG TPA: lysophospholipid acyltransferase family protein [Chthoniobacteraceae bacterium]|jgi:hypothetical protein|nr:lysophospholipid acyltransferase family protein [Chthoniobacteraceae bacterium]